MKKYVVLGLALLNLNAMAQESLHGAVKIYDAKFVPGIVSLFVEGKMVMNDGVKVKKRVTKDAVALNDNLVKVREFFRIKFNRNSFDDLGADIRASVNVNKFAFPDILGQRQNAAWMSTRFSFGAGKRSGLDDFAQALDVVGHEFTHAIVQSTSNLKYEGQSGALNEHMADVFGAIINQYYNHPANPYLIGATILKGDYKKKAEALRDMMNPEKGLSPQPSHMRDLEKPEFSKFGEACVASGANDRCGVHSLSGIPNRVFALTMSKLSINDTADLYYNVMTKRLKPYSKFADYAEALRSECQVNGQGVCTVVDDALKAVGL
ncbi:MAG: M4 family metallopeptidase [Bacteriovoracaceae bacterium]